jgi:hypothetical protein
MRRLAGARKKRRRASSSGVDTIVSDKPSLGEDGERKETAASGYMD